MRWLEVGIRRRKRLLYVRNCSRLRRQGQYQSFQAQVSSPTVKREIELLYESASSRSHEVGDGLASTPDPAPNLSFKLRQNSLFGSICKPRSTVSMTRSIFPA
jgi:hypothetical protein